MKNCKKWLAAALALVLTATALTGCGKPQPPTASSLLQEMSVKMAAQDSVAADVQGFVEFKQDSEGFSLGFHVDLDMAFEILRDPLLIHAKGTAGMELLGMDLEIPMELYAREEDEAVAAYVNVMDTWMQQRTEKGEGVGVVDLTNVKYEKEFLDAAVLQEETEEVLGKTAYRIDMTLTGEMMEKAREAMDAETLEGMPEFDWSSVTVDTTLWLDTETGLPVRQSVTLTSPIRGGELSINALEILLDYTGFNTVEGITIPSEALDAPSTENLLDSML